ncbi:hypothetical protein DO97_11195 [Neosynechococcus sphagnicola sy1]|uniref:Uncharacterized protein n=2 Tax=Neosynechococcus TaxID=1501143 RepID=A0A098TMY3_9CYAN|nr:hypothetical protein DO97_11195 [Neosynechococcus sphagnicola sy1]
MMLTMRIVDQLYQCNVPGQDGYVWQLHCHLRIFQQHPGHKIVMVSDRGCETGWFIPYKLEQLATRIVQDFQLNPDRLTWIEHDPNDGSRQDCIEFSQVVFQWQDGKATDPQWRAIDDQLAALIIGEMLQLATASAVRVG